MISEEPPSSLSGAAVSAPQPSVTTPSRWRVRLLLVVVIVITVGTIVFGVMGFVRDSSFDLPLPHDIRLGFHQNGWPLRWTCPVGHDHWSLPYWSGTLAFSLFTLWIWRAYLRVRISR